VNDVHVRGTVRADWSYRGDVYLRLLLAPSRGHEPPQGALVVRVPVALHRGMTEFRYGQTLEVHGWLEVVPRDQPVAELLKTAAQEASDPALEAARAVLPAAAARHRVQTDQVQVVAERWEAAPSARPPRRRGGGRRRAAPPGPPPSSPATPDPAPASAPDPKPEQEQTAAA